MHKHLGNLGITFLALLNVTLWFIFPPPPDPSRLQFEYQFVSEMLSSTAMVIMACAFILALKPKFLEPYFGGLDKMYQAHKSAALVGIALIFAHFFLMPITFKIPLGNRLGTLALIGFTILILLSLAPSVPLFGNMVRLAYHQWKWTHKLIGAFYIIGFLHTLNVPNILATAEIPALYWKVLAYTGMAAYVYKELLAPFMQKPKPYTVDAVRQLNGTTLEVSLKPHSTSPHTRAGQFTFVSFPQDRVLAEAHPFTISSAPHEALLRLSIKASGDWTRHLYQNLKAGMAAHIEGCYGQLDYRAGGAKQIWVAGGIGVTPFLSWVRSLESNPAAEINFFYTVRAENDVLFWDEFESATKKFPNFKATLNISSKGGSLNMEKIATSVTGKLVDYHVYMCGPVPLIEAFKKNLQEAGLPKAHIHYEEFNFR